ncbi:OmpH family outer membrane protein [Roseobacter sp.]|uniref:OmpH family outer membrane protein n=1 Tax=Roseobacter sp. TaxID=1907202 RepID=UPI003859D32E
MWLCIAGSDAQAQRIGPIQSPILTIDSERLFSESAFGQRVVSEFEERGAELAAENRRIEEELSLEEKDLTEKRATMPAPEFRELADAFDEKVQVTRRTQDAKTRDLNVALEGRRVVFLNAAAPILEQLMREAGAAVILERRSIFLSSNAIDVTRTAIDRLDTVLGDGSDAPEQ